MEKENAVPVENNTASKNTSKGKQYRVTLKLNQRFDIKIGRKDYNFQPYGSIVVDESERNHPDLVSLEKDFFTVCEVK